MVNIPKKMRTFCKKSGKHEIFKVSQYKKGKENKWNQGKRRYDKKQAGYGGQTKPIQHNKAKTTKKLTLRLECTYKRKRDGVKVKTRRTLLYPRAKTIILGGERKKKG